MDVRQGREGDKCRAGSLGDHVGVSRWSHRGGVRAAVHHWLRAASQLAAQGQHHVELGANPAHSATMSTGRSQSVRVRADQRRVPGTQRGLTASAPVSACSTEPSVPRLHSP